MSIFHHHGEPTQITIVPAHPSWNVLCAEYDNVENKIPTGIFSVPIIAWAIETSLIKCQNTRTKTSEEIFSHGFKPIAFNFYASEYAVELPDGKIHLDTGESFQNRAELLEFWAREAALKE